MDIKTKFDVGNTCLFLMADKKDTTNVRVVEGVVSLINVRSDKYGTTWIYTVKDDTGNELDLEEEILCKNHQEIVKYLFRNENLRTFINKDHKISKRKDGSSDRNDLNSIFEQMALIGGARDGYSRHPYR